MLNFIENIFQIQIIKNAFWFGFISSLIAITISPIQFLKIQKQSTGSSYISIIKYYYKNHGLKIFFIGSIEFSFLQFFSSAAFGVSEFFSRKIIINNNLEFNPISIIISTIFAGFLETIFTIIFEFKAIEANKINLIERKTSYLNIFFPLLYRNSLYWIGSLGSIFIINILEKKYNINFTNSLSLLLSFFIGLFWAIMTTPIDMIISQKVGSDNDIYKKQNIFIILKDKITNDGISEILRGSLARISLSTIFTIGTVLTQRFLN
jgi:hypothetical protein